MFNGPLSERIDCISEKPQLPESKKSGKEKSNPNRLSLNASGSQPEENPQVWDVTQVNCPIPPRCPDMWVH